MAPPPLPYKSSPSAAPHPSTAGESELAHSKRLLAERINELKHVRHEYGELKLRLGERDARIRQLESELAELRAASADAPRSQDSQRLTALNERLRAAEAALAERAGRVQALENALRARGEGVEMSRFLAVERTLAARERKLRELESELELAQGWSAGAHDDLTRIKGIGPKLRERLNAAGVTRFAQIAAWTSADLASYAQKLKIHASRIERDGWIESAKALG